MAKIIRYCRMRMLWVLMLLLWKSTAIAQPAFTVQYIPVEKDSAAIFSLPLDSQFSSSALALQYIEKLPALLQGQGYMAASVDSVVVADTQALVHLFVGQKFLWANIAVEEKYKLHLLQANVPPALLGNTLTLPQFRQVQQKLLDHFEDSGYPFAQVGLKNVAISNNQIRAALYIYPGHIYKIDSIRLRGNARISQNFIQRYLDLPQGAPYQKSKLAKLNQRLLELPYLQQVQPWDISMLNTGSLLNLYLEPKRSNQVNVLAGFLPSNQQIGGKLLLTVDANLQLQNAFGTGERIGVLWQQIQPKSPRLNLQYMQPYLFKSPFGVDFSFELFKKDSSFLNLDGELGLVYMISTNKTAKLLVQTQSTSVLEVDTMQVKFTRRLPTVADVSSVNIGVDYQVNATNYRFNPRQGHEILVFAGVGQKTIKKNNAITAIKDPSFDYSRLYDTLQLKTYQLRLTTRFAKYFPLGRQGVLKSGLQAGWYQSPNAFRNELFQVGGYRLMRGFDEESIFASTYAVATAEYRFLLGLNSNFFAFTDFGLTSNTITRQKHNYLGAGLGLSFETRGGIFNLSYAAGKRNDLNFDIRQSKIHFGYVSIF